MCNNYVTNESLHLNKQILKSCMEGMWKEAVVAQFDSHSTITVCEWSGWKKLY